MSLFIDSLAQNQPGLKDEKQVWQIVKEAFYGREVIAFMHYPIFRKDGQGRKEIDILVIDRQLGLLIFEVKGVLLSQIMSIKGHTWYYQNFYQKMGNPYQQAESQMFMLGNWLNRKLSIEKDILSKRAFVVLPRTNRKSWEEKKFPNFPIIFQEDLVSSLFLTKIKQSFYSKVENNLTNKQWKQIKGVFGVNENDQEQIKYEIPLLESEDYFLPSDDAIWHIWEELDELSDFH